MSVLILLPPTWLFTTVETFVLHVLYLLSTPPFCWNTSTLLEYIAIICCTIAFFLNFIYFMFTLSFNLHFVLFLQLNIYVWKPRTPYKGHFSIPELSKAASYICTHSNGLFCILCYCSDFLPLCCPTPWKNSLRALPSPTQLLITFHRIPEWLQVSSPQWNYSCWSHCKHPHK